MNNMSYLIEYYDELYEVSSEQKKFYADLALQYGMPTRFLRVDCGTGYFEHFLAKAGHDSTGLETSKEMLERANLRRRMPNTAVRFFQMSYLEMTRFLGKGFYNVISCLNNRIIYIHDKTLRRKFFYDCHILLKEKGVVILELNNFTKFSPNPMVRLPEHSSIRAKLFTQLWQSPEQTYYIKEDLQISSGKIVSIDNDEKKTVYPVSYSELEKDALEAGFSKVEKFANFNREEFTSDSDNLVLVCHY